MQYWVKQLRWRLGLLLVRTARRLIPAYRQHLFIFARDGGLYEVRLYADQAEKVLRAVQDMLHYTAPKYVE